VKIISNEPRPGVYVMLVFGQKLKLDPMWKYLLGSVGKWVDVSDYEKDKALSGINQCLISLENIKHICQSS